MEDSQADHPANEFEVVEMLRVDSGVRVYLQGIVIVSGVFKEAVERVEHFVRKKEEKFPVQRLEPSPTQYRLHLPR